jgi:RsiW-degrading membrane proteinase PrsW (M82 family)
MPFGGRRRPVKESKPLDQMTVRELWRSIVAGSAFGLLLSAITLWMFYQLLFHSLEPVWAKVPIFLLLFVACVPVTTIIWGGVVITGVELRRRKKSDQS